MTHEQLTHLRELHARATPEPWEPSFNVDAPHGGKWAPNLTNREGRGEGPTHAGAYAEVREKAWRDSELIAALRNAFPGMADELESLRAEVARLQGELDLARSLG